MLNIKNLKINGNIAVAPLAGFSDPPFRQTAINFNAAFTVTEMISSNGIVRNNKKTMDLLKFSEAERPLGIQLFGNDPEVMKEAAHIVEDLHPDFIDINFGCPARKVVKAGSGSALLANPQLMEKICLQITRSVSIPVSAKIRTGPNTENKNYIETIKLLQNSGISFITVHGRTMSQAFSGDSDWDAVKEIKAISSIPVIGNGDIKSYSEAIARLEASGCDCVMIGRGAIGNPWIFSGEIPDDNERIKQIKKHLNLMTEFYGNRGIILFRKHLVKYIRGMKNSARLRAILLKTTDKSELIDTIERNILE